MLYLELRVLKDTILKIRNLSVTLLEGVSSSLTVTSADRVFDLLSLNLRVTCVHLWRWSTCPVLSTQFRIAYIIGRQTMYFFVNFNWRVWITPQDDSPHLKILEKIDWLLLEYSWNESSRSKQSIFSKTITSKILDSRTGQKWLKSGNVVNVFLCRYWVACWRGNLKYTQEIWNFKHYLRLCWRYLGIINRIMLNLCSFL